MPYLLLYKDLLHDKKAQTAFISALSADEEGGLRSRGREVVLALGLSFRFHHVAPLERPGAAPEEKGRSRGEGFNSVGSGVKLSYSV